MIKVSIIPKDNFLAMLQARIAVMGAGSMPATVAAFKAGVRVAQATWKGYAMGEQIPGSPYRVKHPSGGYAAAVQVRQEGPFDYTVFNDSAAAHALDDGTPELDMKTTHPYGPKSRVANHGTKKNPRWVPYLIVPFRWGTPGSSGGHFRNIIPDQIYAMLRTQIKSGVFVRTKVSPTSHVEPNFWGESVKRAEYEGEEGQENWGSMLRNVGGNMEGMSAMNADTSGKKSSTYFTFRVISAESPAGSWIKPATPAMHISQHVADNVRDIISEMVESGMKVDLGVQ